MEEIKNYFSKKAKDYDLVEKQLYWKLSDKILWEIFKKKILLTFPKRFSFLDAGGGTGRWTKKILEEFPESIGVIYDFSEEMLSESKKKLEKFGKQVEIIKGDLEKIDCFQEESFDLVFNFHNVLGFVHNEKKAFSEMAKVLKKDGILASIVPNLYHTIFFNLKLGEIDLAKKAFLTKRGKFIREMPEIGLFTPEKLRNLYLIHNFKEINILGFPITIYPGYEETQIKDSSNGIKDILSNENIFNEIYNIEINLISEENSTRGNNLFVWGRK